MKQNIKMIKVWSIRNEILYNKLQKNLGILTPQHEDMQFFCKKKEFRKQRRY